MDYDEGDSLDTLTFYIFFTIIMCICCPIRLIIREILIRERHRRLLQRQNDNNELVLLREVQIEMGLEDYSNYMVEINKDNIELNECIICYDEFKERDTVILRCGHFFHGDCINQWFNFKDTCPICRKCCRF